MAKRAWGVSSIEFAPVTADGSIPTTGWTRIINIQEGSVTFNVPEPSVNNIFVEDVDGAIDVLPTNDQEPAEIGFSTVELEGDKVVELIGGTYAGGQYDAPAVSEIKHLAVRVTCRPHRGLQFQFVIRNGAVVSNIAATPTKGELIALGFIVRATTPFDGSGNPVSPWSIIELPVTT